MVQSRIALSYRVFDLLEVLAEMEFIPTPLSRAECI